MAMNLNKYAVMGIDPGGSTGVSAAYGELEPTMRETAEGLYKKKTITITGSYLEQAKQIASIMNAFQYTANVENSIPLSNVRFAIEDFVLRRKKEGGATGNLTSCWVAAGAVAIFGSEQSVTWRQASTAKNFAKNDRMKSWGLWVPGSPHETDANRHLASEFNDLIIVSGI